MKFGNLEILDNQRSLEKGLFVLLYCIAGQPLVLENVKIIIALLFPVVFLPRAYPEQNVTISDAVLSQSQAFFLESKKIFHRYEAESIIDGLITSVQTYF